MGTLIDVVAKSVEGLLTDVELAAGSGRVRAATRSPPNGIFEFEESPGGYIATIRAAGQTPAGRSTGVVFTSGEVSLFMLSVREIDQLLLLLTGRMHRYKGPRLRGFPGIGSCFVYGKRDPIVDTLRDDTLTGIERLFSVQSANGGWASLHFACGYCQLWTSRLSESDIGASIQQALAGFIGLQHWLLVEA